MVQIEDPVGDANFLNDSHAAPFGKGQRHRTGRQFGIGDILKVWFTHDAATVSAHIQTEAAAPGGNGIGFSVFASPGEGEAGSNTVGCVRFWLVLPGTNPGGGSYQGQPIAKLHDRCNTGGNIYDSVDGEFAIEAVA